MSDTMYKETIMEKARPTKYYKRVPKSTGKGYTYYYTKDSYDKSRQQQPEEKKEKSDSWIGVFASFFGFNDRKQVMQKVESDYKSHEIAQKYTLSWDGWKNHLAEYFTNKDKWDNFFSRNKEKSKKPATKKPEPVEKKEKEKKVKKDGLKLSVMKEIFSMYGGSVKQEEQPKPVEDNFDTMPETETQEDINEQYRKEGKLPPHLQAIADKQKGFEITDVTPPGYGPEEPEQTTKDVQKDKEITKELNNATPETRVETAAELMDENKEPWGMTFEQLKEKMIPFRDQSTIDHLKKEIEKYKKYLTPANEKQKDAIASQYKWATRRIKDYQNLLDEYIEGTVDANYKTNPSWDYIKKQYESMKDKDSKEAKSLKRKLTIRENKLKKEHERLIKKAINDGQVIPANVLKEYPEIMAEDSNKMVIPDINYVPETIEKQITLGGGKAFESGSNVRNIKIKDYSQIKPKDVYLVDEETILKVPRPSYIPEMDLEDFAGRKGKEQNFDVVRIGPDQYIIVDKRYPINLSGGFGASASRSSDSEKETEKREYSLMSAETLAATWDYYRKLYREKQREEHEIKQDTEEEYYNKRKKAALDAGRDWPYAPFKRKQYRAKNIQPDSTRMSYNQAFLIQDFTEYEAPASEFREGEANRAIFNNYHDMLKELDYKINDMRIQKEMMVEAGTYQKGQETAYGESGTKDDLVGSFGIKVKRQNGSEIDDQDIARIGMLMDDIYSVFGNKKSIAEKSNLKVSYAGSKKMHASQAIGMFVPKYNTIAISDDGIEGRGFTFAHEFAHFLDKYIGDETGLYFASDQDGSLENTIASTFRKGLTLSNDVGEQAGKYFNRTCECFARSMEQFYAIKQGTEKELYGKRNKSGAYMNHDQFVNTIYPLCEEFLSSRESMLKAFMKKFNIKTNKFEYKRIK